MGRRHTTINTPAVRLGRCVNGKSFYTPKRLLQFENGLKILDFDIIVVTNTCSAFLLTPHNWLPPAIEGNHLLHFVAGKTKSPPQL